MRGKRLYLRGKRLYLRGRRREGGKRLYLRGWWGRGLLLALKIHKADPTS